MKTIISRLLVPFAAAVLLLPLRAPAAAADSARQAAPTAFLPFLPDQPGLAGNAAVKAHLGNVVSSRGSVRLIVRLKTDVQPEHLLSLQQLQAQRGKITAAQDHFLQRMGQYSVFAKKRFTTLPFVVLEANEPALSHILAASPDVLSIQEDALMQPSLAQSVPLIGVTPVWDFGVTGTGQAVAIIDSGVDASHPFLSGKVIAEACFSSDTVISDSVCPNGAASQAGPGAAAPCALADCRHGTHVAGIAAGKGSSFSGVAKDAQIIAVQVFSAFTTGCAAPPCLSAYTSDIMKGLEHVYSLRNTYRIASVNMSLGGGAFNTYCDTDSLKPVIDNLRSAGIATIIASGNESKTSQISSPACISSAISVGATTKSDAVASYSNSAGILRLLAPGSAITSSVPGGGFASMSGTSMATPHVTGIWALAKSRMPDASVTDILNALSYTGLKVTDSRNSIIKPRVKAGAALALLAGLTPPPPVGTCFNTGNADHVSAGRATANGANAFAKGSVQNLGLNNVSTYTKLRQIGVTHYVIDNACPSAI